MCWNALIAWKQNWIHCAHNKVIKAKIKKHLHYDWTTIYCFCLTRVLEFSRISHCASYLQQITNSKNFHSSEFTVCVVTDISQGICLLSLMIHSLMILSHPSSSTGLCCNLSKSFTFVLACTVLRNSQQRVVGDRVGPVLGWGGNIQTADGRGRRHQRVESQWKGRIRT